MSLANPTAKCIGCGEERPTHRVGSGRSDRACSECIRTNRVPAVPAGPSTYDPKKKNRRA